MHGAPLSCERMFVVLMCSSLSSARTYVDTPTPTHRKPTTTNVQVFLVTGKDAHVDISRGVGDCGSARAHLREGDALGPVATAWDRGARGQEQEEREEREEEWGEHEKRKRRGR